MMAEILNDRPSQIMPGFLLLGNYAREWVLFEVAKFGVVVH
jgi:hypothetical protein